MIKTVGFLHTAQAHVQSFELLLKQVAPDVAGCSVVEPNILKVASEQGVTDSVVKGLESALDELVQKGAEAIACTCSTLGGIAEGRVVGGIKVQRIDRAAADLLM